MADNVTFTAPRYAVKFPDLDPKTEFKPRTDGLSDYFPVEFFSVAGHRNKYEGDVEDGQRQLQECIPVEILVHEKVRPMLEKLFNTGMIDDDITCKEMGRDDYDEATTRYEQKLKKPWIDSCEGNVMRIKYQAFESKSYYKDGSTIPGGFDFLKQKKTT